uniref:Gnk2-homologous domain-containing protein n=1 Tax=Leersia perrieri TaxID=77586 RepID=A0A0D9W3M9_9ORYZ
MCIGKTTPEDCVTCLRITELHIRRLYNDTQEASICLTAQFMNESQMFAIGSVVYDINPPSEISVTLYRMVQCMRDFTEAQCQLCLNISVVGGSGCCWGALGGKVYIYDCYMHYEAYTVTINVRLGLSSQHAIWHPLYCQPNQIRLALASPTRFALLSRKDGYDQAIVCGMFIGENTPEDCATCLHIAELHIQCHCNDTRETSIWYSATSGYGSNLSIAIMRNW